MSAIAENLRAAVTARAGQRCEYCLLPAQGQAGRFPIEHVRPRTLGGPSELSNLAHSCPSCNAHKWAHAEGTDPATGTSTALFNPRVQIWSAHFQWSAQSPGVLEGKTATGRATIARLEMNNPELLALRRLMAALGLMAFTAS